jgi:hypothetical protein
MHFQDEFESRSVWLSAYLIAMGCPIVRVIPSDTRRSRFIHRNDDENTAFRFASEWREGNYAMVNGPAFVEAYRIVLHRARQAEDEAHYARENSQGGTNEDDHEPRSA